MPGVNRGMFDSNDAAMPVPKEEIGTCAVVGVKASADQRVFSLRGDNVRTLLGASLLLVLPQPLPRRFMPQRRGPLHECASLDPILF